MNQILNTDLHRNVVLSEESETIVVNTISNSHTFKDSTSLKKLFQAQFILSIILLFILASFYLYNQFYLNKKENYSDTLRHNYSISQLYSENSPSSSIYTSPTIVGIIEIPKLSLSYPIYSHLDDELLKISPCIFYGEMPPATSNLCIACHNYDNNKFFSNIDSLTKNDKILIYNQSGNKFSYFVFDKYEVAADDLSPVLSDYSDDCELTLITCNNFNKNRIVVKGTICK